MFSLIFQESENLDHSFLQGNEENDLSKTTHFFELVKSLI